MIAVSPKAFLHECLIIVSGLNWTKLLDTKLNTAVNWKIQYELKQNSVTKTFSLNQPPLAGEFYGM